jgi:hypothetical protein
MSYVRLTTYVEIIDAMTTNSMIAIAGRSGSPNSIRTPSE